MKDQNKIPTAEEFFKKYSVLHVFEEGDPEYLIDKEDFQNAIIEFAKLHVREATRSVLMGMFDEADLNTAVEQHLKFLYPIENIK